MIEPILRLFGLGNVSTQEFQILISILTLLSTSFIIFYAIPYVVKNTIDIITTELEKIGQENIVEHTKETIPWLFRYEVFKKSLQLLTLFGAIISMLYIWHQVRYIRIGYEFLISYIPQIARSSITVIVIIGSYIITQIIEKQFRSLSSNTNKINDHEEEIIIRSLQLFIFGSMIFTVLTIWNVDLSGLLLGAGFLGIIVGFAAQKTLGSVISGLMLMFSRPFEIGDWVEIGGHEGIVNEITVVNTRIKSFNGEIIIIPNEEVSSDTIINRSKQNRLRLDVEVGVDYNTDIDKAIDIAIEEMKESNKVIKQPKPDAIPKKFGDSAIIIELRFWIDQPTSRQRWVTISSIVRRIKTRYEEENIKIPFPQREHSTRSVVHNDISPEETQPNTQPQNKN